MEMINFRMLQNIPKFIGWTPFGKYRRAYYCNTQSARTEWGVFTANYTHINDLRYGKA